MKKYGLLGKSLKHSFSKTFFDQYFNTHEIKAEYLNFEAENLHNIKKDLSDFSGFNVTIPYKERIIDFIDYLDSEAAEIGAVNVVLNRDGVWEGYNTDAFGFHQSIKPFLRNIHERAIVFGTGGASKAVEYVLRNLGIDVFFISSGKEGEFIFPYDAINEQMLSSCKLLVNCTPVGMHPNVDEVLPIPFEYISKNHLVVDLIYNPKKTIFLQKCEERGATILNGEDMLRHQALKSWEIWNDV